MPHILEVRFMLPKSAAAFIDLLCSLSCTKREEWLRLAIGGEVAAALDSPSANWNENYLRMRYGLEPFLSEEDAP